MYFKELTAFIAVYEAKSISKAAQKLYMTQPSLTRLIQGIEEQVGSSLFTRTREGLIPTLTGELYMDKANQILKIQKDFELSLAFVNDSNRGRLTIGTKSFFSSSVLPKVISSFQKKFQNVEITIFESLGNDVEKEITKNSVDVAIVHLPTSSDQLVCLPVGKEKFYIAISKDDEINNLAFKKSDGLLYFNLSDLKDKDFLFAQPNQKIRQETDRIISLAKISPNIKLQCTNIHTINNLVSEGVGVSIIPSSYINFNDSNNPNYYNIDSSFNPYCEVGVIYNKDMHGNPFIKEFTNIAKEVLSSIFSF